MASRSRMTGNTKLRRTLRRIDPAITQELRDVVKDGLEAIKWDAISFVPIDEGDLARSIDYKLGRDGLTGVVGPGAKAAELARKKAASGSAFGTVAKKGGGKVRLSRSNQELLWEFFKGYWVEFGTKGNAARNIPPMAPQPFMAPAYDVNRLWFSRRAQRALVRALERASRG